MYICYLLNFLHFLQRNVFIIFPKHLIHTFIDIHVLVLCTCLKKCFLYIHSSIHSFICKHMLKFLFIYFVILFFLNMQPQTPTFHVNSIYPSGLKFSLYFYIIYLDFLFLTFLVFYHT